MGGWRVASLFFFEGVVVSVETLLEYALGLLASLGVLPYLQAIVIIALAAAALRMIADRG